MTNPFVPFFRWLEEAKNCPDIADHTIMSLATVGEDSQPSLRVVLLKSADEQGFVFYTNMNSRKSRELQNNPKAALDFYWLPLGRQLRIEGVAERVSDAEADEYFSSRPRESQLGAWASQQSEPLASREMLMESMLEITKKYAGKEVPRPPYWSGWRVVPTCIEFWQLGDFRLHDRDVYMKEGNSWRMEKLYP